MGKVAVHDLVATTKDRIVVVGRDGEKAKQFAHSFRQSRVTSAVADADHHQELVAAFGEADVVVNCAQYYVNMQVMNACLDAECHYLDLGGLFHMTKKQLALHPRFTKKKLLALLGCGSTPGITNVMAQYGSEMLDRVEEIHISFASYDFIKHRRMPFVIPYSAYTLLDEFTDKPVILTKGKLKFVGPMSGTEQEIFPEPIGTVHAFYTLHSELATFPDSFRKKGLRECTFRVTFPDAFVEKIKFLIDLGLGSRKSIMMGNEKISLRELVAKELNRFLPQDSVVDDMEYLRVLLRGARDKKPLTVVLDCKAVSNPAQGFPAGSVDTGVPPSILAQVIVAGTITERGVLAPEQCVPPELFFKELKKRNIHLFVETKGGV